MGFGELFVVCVQFLVAGFQNFRHGIDLDAELIKLMDGQGLDSCFEVSLRNSGNTLQQMIHGGNDAAFYEQDHQRKREYEEDQENDYGAEYDCVYLVVDSPLRETDVYYGNLLRIE